MTGASTNRATGGDLEYMQAGRMTQGERCALVPERLLASSGAAIKVYAVLSLNGGSFTGVRKLCQAAYLSPMTGRKAIEELTMRGTLVRVGNTISISREWLEVSPVAISEPRENGLEVSHNGLETSPVLARARLPVYELQEQKQEITNVISQGAGALSAPPVKKIGGQNLPHNALIEACHVPPNRHAEVAAALNGSKAVPIGIRTQFAEQLRERNLSQDGEDFELALVEAIGVHVAAYRQTLPPGTLLTPTALAKWWSSLPWMYEQRKVGGKQTAAQKMLAKAKEVAQ